MSTALPTLHTDRHLLLGTIDEEVRALSIRVLGAYAESLGIRTTLLMIVRSPGSIAQPITVSEPELDRIMEFIERERVTHLGFYLMTATLKPYRAIVASLRARGFRGTVMAGGVHVSLRPEESLVDGADYAVQGPGELPLRRIFENADPAGIPGLVWRQNGQIRVNAVSREQNLDLNTLPFPIFRLNRDLVLVNRRLRKQTAAILRQYGCWRGRYYDLVSSRGCPYRCAYCCNVNGTPIRRASVDRVIAELLHVRKNLPWIQGINIQDDSFFLGSDDWIEEFCRRVKTEVGLPFIVRMIPRYVTAERIRRLQEAGLEYVTMGLEASDRLNKTLFSRPVPADVFIRAARIVLESGLYLSIDVLRDNPYEKEEDLKAVATTLNALPRPNWSIVSLSLTPFPGTDLYDRAVKDRMLDRFSTDAYDSMLNPTIPGRYRTPAFWQNLIRNVLPHVNEKTGEMLIRMGPSDPRAVQMVTSLAAWHRRTQALTSWLNRNLPSAYRGLFHVLSALTRRDRPMTPGMRIID